MRKPEIVVFAPDGFKGSATAAQVAAALAAGWADLAPVTAVLRPMADGGEGTLDAFAAAVPGAHRIPVEVTAPVGSLNATIAASWLRLPPTPDAPHGTGIVELASTAGIELFGDRRDPWHASTYGFGEAIAAALDAEVSRLVLGIGSSASTDGGAGMLAALGARFHTAERPVVRPSAHDLRHLTAVDLAGLRPLPPGGVEVLTDVDSPLCGPRGAARVFGPQKGFDAAAALRADAALAHHAGVMADAGIRVDPNTPGAGAAGGTGFALLACGATLVPGAAAVGRLVRLADAAATASVVVTGEGSFDAQSAGGKAPTFVAAVAREAGAVAALVAGRIAPDADTSGFAAHVSLTELAGSTAAALADPLRWARAAGAELARRLAS